MSEAIEQTQSVLEFQEEGHIWGSDVKASDKVLVPLFRAYYRSMGLYNEMSKKDFHRLVQFVPDEEIAPEISEKLDVIARVALESQRNS